ncbi:MAG TPA: VTT domain-containing protein [Vicinamibacterales bacterium]|nr:VTT domain-containing protein [Vicinamibacterales bacterium]
MLRKLEAFALGLGAPGLFLLAFLDSSFIALPEVVDILVVFMVIEDPARWLFYGGLATAGSVAGCLVLYELARRGGDAFLRKRLKEHHMTRAMALFARYGTLALIVPSLMPPPVPFKPFVLMAGVAGMPRARFIAAVTFGRGVRYGGEALLAVMYGQAALTYLQENARTVSIALTIAVALGLGGYWTHRVLRRRRESGRKTLE